MDSRGQQSVVAQRLLSGEGERGAQQGHTREMH